MILVETAGDAVELLDHCLDSWVPGPGDPLLGPRWGGLDAVEELEMRQAERETRRLTPVAVKDPVEQGGELVVAVVLRARGVLPVFDFQGAQETAHLLADASDLQVSLEAVVEAPHQVSADVGDKMIVTDEVGDASIRQWGERSCTGFAHVADRGDRMAEKSHRLGDDGCQ